MIIITGSILGKDKTIAELRALCIAHSRRSRSERGCLSHEIHVDLEKPLRLAFLERWSDREAVATHFSIPASGDFVKNLRRLAAEPPLMSIYAAEPVQI